MKEQQEAKEKLDAMLQQNKPKNLRQGVGTGVNNIVAGAIGKFSRLVHDRACKIH